MADTTALEAGSLGTGNHFTAALKPKQRPGAATGEVVSGSVAFFWGSRDQKYHFPPDALEANPEAPEGTEQRDLFDALRCVISQRTFFHGLMVSECRFSEFQAKGMLMPVEYWLRLIEQREAARLSFARAWNRLRPLMAHRFQLLQGLWRGEQQAPLLETTVLTLMLCDGWAASAVAGLDPATAVVYTHYISIRGRRLMPYSGYLVERCKTENVGFPADVEGVFDCAKLAWEAACRSGFKRDGHAPPCERARSIFATAETGADEEPAR